MFRAAVKPSLAAAGNAFCAFAILLRAESQWFAGPRQTPLGACAEPMRFTPRHMTSRAHLEIARDRRGRLESNVC